MDRNSRAARILQLSLSKTKSPTNPVIPIDLSSETAADIMADIVLNNTENNCIDLGVLENFSNSECPEPQAQSSSLKQSLPLPIAKTPDKVSSPTIFSGASNDIPLPTYTSTPKAKSPPASSTHAVQIQTAQYQETLTVVSITTQAEAAILNQTPSNSSAFETTSTIDRHLIEEENMTSAKKKKRGPDGWRQNTMKRRRELGQEYQSSVAAARTIGEMCNGCRSGQKECFIFTEEDRLEIFKHVWTLSWDEKRNFIYGLVDRLDVKRRRSKACAKNRQCTYVYSLKKEGQKRNVCLKMFLSTTGLTKHFVTSLFHNTDPSPTQNDNASAIFHKPKKQRISSYYNRSEDARHLLHQFLDELPKMPSHYSRKSSSKLYLERCFKTLVDIHSSYAVYCSEKNINPLKLTVFKEVFHEKNLSLFVPKKDRCNLCIGHEVGNVSEEEWRNHMEFKNEALEEKKKDKMKAICSLETEDKKFAAFCMDLESVLLAPNTEANAMYFKTKLTVHNFTVYNLASGAVSCYVWNETEGGMTASEFASCILHYLQNLDRYEQIVIYSDGCTYQNRNVLLANALQSYVNSTGAFIEHKYLVRGHTHMEVDNSHSLIERALAGRTINVPYDYVDIIRRARQKPSPFTVHYLSYEFFKDFSDIGPYESIRPGKKAGDPTVTDVHSFKYSPDVNGTKVVLQYKLSFNEDYKDIPTPRHFEAKQSKIPSQLYTERLKIPKSKYQHLQELKAVIGKDYHSFYDQLLFKE